MFKEEAIEAVPIVNATLEALLAWVPTRGREGANLRSDIMNRAREFLQLLATDTIGPPLAQAASRWRARPGRVCNSIEHVRATAAAKEPMLRRRHHDSRCADHVLP